MVNAIVTFNTDNNTASVQVYSQSATPVLNVTVVNAASIDEVEEALNNRGIELGCLLSLSHDGLTGNHQVR